MFRGGKWYRDMGAAGSISNTVQKPAESMADRGMVEEGIHIGDISICSNIPIGFINGASEFHHLRFVVGDVFQVEMGARCMVFQKPSKGSGTSIQETFHRVFHIRYNGAEFVNVFIFCNDIGIRYRGVVGYVERVETVPAIPNIAVVPVGYKG